MTPSKMQKPDEFVALLDPELMIYQLAAHLARRNDKRPCDYESSIWTRMRSAIRRGDLSIRAAPLWNKVYPDEAFREDGGLYGYSEKGYALAVADLHRWMVGGGMPTPADAKGLWEILQQEDPTPETQTGRQDAPARVAFIDVRHSQRGPWYKTNKTLYIGDALGALSDTPEGEGSEKQRVITWITSVYGGSEETWKGIIKVGDIAAVKNEKREK